MERKREICENYPAANDSKVHKPNSIFILRSFFNKQLHFHERLEEDLIYAKATTFLHQSNRRGTENEGLIPKRGKRPIFVPGIPVQLGRPVLSLEPGAFTGFFLLLE